jgi:long-subunit fatty acid transport protein
MGGTGIAVSHGAETTLSNPAMITSVEGTEISFGGILFMPNIKSGFDNAPLTTSDADTNIVPEVSIAHRLMKTGLLVQVCMVLPVWVLTIAMQDKCQQQWVGVMSICIW